MLNYKIVEIGSFLTNKNKRLKHEYANSLHYKRITKIDFEGNIHLRNNVPSKTDMIEVDKGDLIISGINVSKGALSILTECDKALATIHYSTYIYNKEMVNIDYLKYFFKSKYFNEILEKNIKGGIKTEIKPKHFLKLKIPLPPLAEQVNIAEKLIKIDKLLCSLKEINAQTSDYLREYLKQLSSFIIAKNSKFSTYKLRDIISFGPKNGFSPQSVGYKTNIKNLTLTATSSGHFLPNNYKYVDINIDDNSDLWLRDGDILIQRGNSIEYVGISAIYKGNDKEFIYPDLMIKIRANSEIILDEYLHLYLNSQKMRQYFKSNASGTSGSMPKINHKTLLNADIDIPSLNKQQELVDKYNYLYNNLSKIYSNIEENKKVYLLLDNLLLYYLK